MNNSWLDDNTEYLCLKCNQWRSIDEMFLKFNKNTKECIGCEVCCK